MTDTKAPFRPLDDVIAPDIWSRVGDPPTHDQVDLFQPPRRRPIVALVAALAVTGVIVVTLLVTFARVEPSRPGGSSATSELAAIVRGTDELMQAHQRFLDATVGGDAEEIEMADVALGEARTSLRALVQAAPQPPVTVDSSVEDQVAMLVRLVAEKSLELVAVNGDDPRYASIQEQLAFIRDQLNELCARAGPGTTEAVCEQITISDVQGSTPSEGEAGRPPVVKDAAIMTAHGQVESLLQRLWTERARISELQGEVQAAQSELQALLIEIGSGQPTEVQAARLDEAQSLIARFQGAIVRGEEVAQSLEARLEDSRKALDDLVGRADPAVVPTSITVTCTELAIERARLP
jgi:hypothetical protein